MQDEEEGYKSDKSHNKIIRDYDKISRKGESEIDYMIK